MSRSHKKRRPRKPARPVRRLSPLWYFPLPVIAGLFLLYWAVQSDWAPLPGGSGPAAAQPDSVVYALALVRAQTQDVEGALALLHTLRRRSPDYYPQYRLLMSIGLALKDLELMETGCANLERLFRDGDAAFRADAADGRFCAQWFNYAFALRNAGQYRQALDKLQFLQREWPEYPMQYGLSYDIGRITNDSTLIEASLASLDRLFAAQPELIRQRAPDMAIQMWAGRAARMEAAARWPEAIASYRNILLIDAGHRIDGVPAAELIRRAETQLLHAGPGARDSTYSLVHVPSIFGDHMVVQRDREFPLWGATQAGATVAVTLGDRSYRTRSDSNGRWQVLVGALPAGGPHTLRIQCSDYPPLMLRDILIGDVWLCAGQSNMAVTLKVSAQGGEVRRAAGNPQLRFYTVQEKAIDRPRADVNGVWAESTPETAGDFSAVAYYFGRDLSHATGVPIGLINCSVGATKADAWMSREALQSDPAFQPVLDAWDRASVNNPDNQADFTPEYLAWSQARADALAQGRPAPDTPMPARYLLAHDQPAGLYNGMIHPLEPFRVRGVIWYQGEGDATDARLYRRLFPALIRDWRTHRSQPDLPFLFVQLPNIGDWIGGDWPLLRESQAAVLDELPHTAMAVTIDIGEADNLHPGNKSEVGRRLALAALATVYGRSVEYSGPLYETSAVEETRMRLHFRHTAQGLQTPGGAPLLGFDIAGGDRQFLPAQARIDGASVVVWHDRVPQPAAVRYGWAHNPPCNLYNSAQLPAAPFRTDEW